MTACPKMLAANPDRRMRFVSLDGGMITKTFSQVHEDVAQLMSELSSSGIGAGDLVGLLGPNTYEWAIADLALIGLRCVSVALPAEGKIEPIELREMTERYRLSALLVTRAVPIAQSCRPPPRCLRRGRCGSARPAGRARTARNCPQRSSLSRSPPGPRAARRA